MNRIVRSSSDLKKVQDKKKRDRVKDEAAKKAKAEAMALTNNSSAINEIMTAPMNSGPPKDLLSELNEDEDLVV